MNFLHFYHSNLILVQGTFVTLFLALSLQVPLRMGVISFAGVGSYGIGSSTTAILVLRYGWSTIPALALGVLLPAIIGGLLALLLRRLTGLYLGMATISFDLIIGVLAINGGTFTGGPTGLYGALARPPLAMSYIVAITVAALLALSYTERGALTRRISVVREDPELASALGIRVPRYRSWAFVVSGALGGCAGAMNLLLRATISPENIGFSLVVLSLTVIIVGGTGWWFGALVGSIIFTWLPEVLSFISEWQAVIYGVLVVLAAVYVPGGVVGMVVEQWRRWQQRKLRRLAESLLTAEDEQDKNDIIATIRPTREATPQ